MLRKLKCAFFVFSFVFLSAPAVAAPDLKDYAGLPVTGFLKLSPDGSKIVTKDVVDDKELICVREIASRDIKCVADATDLNANGIFFANKNTLIVTTRSKTTYLGWGGEYYKTAATAIDIKSGKVHNLLETGPNLYEDQPYLDSIVSVSLDGKYVFMPALAVRGSDYAVDVFKVSTKTGRGTTEAYGRLTTQGWFLTPEGEAIARTDFDNKKNLHTLHSYLSGSSKEIWSQETKYTDIGFVALTPDYKKIIAVEETEENNADAIYLVDLATGEFGEPQYSIEGKDIEDIFIDRNNIFYGVRYSGAHPSYKMVDPDVDNFLKQVGAAYPKSSVYLTSWSDDWNRIALWLSGGDYPGLYIIFDRELGAPVFAAERRPSLKKEDLGEVEVLQYLAQDGTPIEAILTYPVGSSPENRMNMPLVVLPHGGPTAYDSAGYDWMAQSIASHGYAVLQPNFRGSTGYGPAFELAGRGKWGKEMQSDVTDGLDFLTKFGFADKDRVCIVGWSYGGYASLAGGSLTPDKYKCIIAIAGVSDLPMMLESEREDYGRFSSSYEYWTDVIGDLKTDRDNLEKVSPAYLADKFEAPVLLIHGKDDLVVPDEQSKRMEKALKEAGKPVELILIDDQGHSLSTQNARVDAFSKVLEFLDENIGAETTN